MPCPELTNPMTDDLRVQQEALRDLEGIVPRRCKGQGIYKTGPAKDWRAVEKRLTSNMA